MWKTKKPRRTLLWANQRPQ